MKHITFLANNDLVLKCESGTIEFSKGSYVDLRHDENQNIWISYHEDAEDKVVAFELQITDKDVFSALLENLVLVEHQLDSKVSYEERQVDQLIIEENIDPIQLMQYMVESNYQKVVVENSKVRIPVRRVQKEMTNKQKATAISSTQMFEHDQTAQSQRVKSILIRESGQQGYFIENSLLFSNSLDIASNEVFEALSAYFGDKAKVKLNQEGQVLVNLFNSDEENLIEALEALNYNYVLEGEEDQKTITLFQPDSTPVVEAYFEAKEEEEEEEDKKKDMDDEEDKDDKDMDEKEGKKKENEDDMDDDEEMDDEDDKDGKEEKK